jgi:hypothetical protein
MKINEQHTFNVDKDENPAEESVKKAKNISDEEYWKNKCRKEKRYPTNNATGGAIYGLGFVGAAVFFISNAVGFWAGVLGFLKAIIWPAILVYEVLNEMSV